MTDVNPNENEVQIKEEMATDCKYCGEACDPYKKPSLKCIGECLSNIHVKCLKRGDVPGSLLGDVFFELICAECSPINAELINRIRMSWLNIIILTLYNLREKSSGISKRGYFHWKSDISTFVDKNWDYLFQKGVKKRKNWVGTISGTLSHYSTSSIAFFKSGTNELNELGWWRLYSNDPPELLMTEYNKMINQRKKLGSNQLNIHEQTHTVNQHQRQLEQQQQQQQQQQDHSPSRSEESNCSFGDDSNCDGNYVNSSGGGNGGESSRNNTPSMFSREYVQPSEILSDFLMADDEITPDIDLLDIDNSLDINDQSNALSIADLICDYQNKNSSSYSSSSSVTYNCGNSQFSQLLNTFNHEWMNNVLNQSNTFDNNRVDKDLDDEIERYEEESSNDSTTTVQQHKQRPPSPPSSLFILKNHRDRPWKKKTVYSISENNPRMTRYEEEYLLHSVNKTYLDKMPSNVRRLYRKLAVRKIKRDYNLPLLDIDNFGVKSTVVNKIKNLNSSNRVIDRFFNDNLNATFEQRLQGQNEPIAVHSPYTTRLLKPFIRRDKECKPLWLRVINELCAKVNRNNYEFRPQPLATIDYCYVRPQHIPAINSLCSQFFWPGVDLTECLQYPDFTCVVLYKKLVIGFAMLVPDVGYNEAYISFFFVRPEWRRAGIGTYMLYHLIQTCMGKDVTLHVSVTNPAVILYQKFGFKIEEFVQDFYDKYVTSGPRESRHALFLRLSR